MLHGGCISFMANVRDFREVRWRMCLSLAAIFAGDLLDVGIPSHLVPRPVVPLLNVLICLHIHPFSAIITKY